MKRNLMFLFLFLFLFSITSWADTVYLKDGQAFQGKIITHTKYSTKIVVEGFPKVFYADEIDRVEQEEPAATIIEEEVLDAEVSDGEVSDEKKQLILSFLKANGALQGIQQAVRNFVGELSDEKRKEFEQQLNADALIDRFVPIYAKYYTQAELEEMVRFYSSATGKKVVEVTPKIMEESFLSAGQYFMDMENPTKEKQ